MYRSKEEFDQAHIPNAFNMSTSRWKTHVWQLDKEFQFNNCMWNKVEDVLLMAQIF